MKHLLTILIVFSTLIVIGQNDNNIWYFGDGNFIGFNLTTPTIIEAGTQIATATSTYCLEGTSAVSDATGQLLFYSDGRSVWNKTHNLMPNGSGLNGHQSSAQVLIVPNPGNPNLYYIFYSDFFGQPNGFSYSEVDISLNGNLGDVTSNKNIQLHTSSAEMVKAVTHCNGSDIWVISHDDSGNTFRAYLVTPAGVNPTPVTSSVGTPFPQASIGTMPISPSYMTCRKDGKKIAINVFTMFEIFDFDNQNGTLCSPISVPFGGTSSGYGIEYSEDGTKLYISNYNLHQFDVSSNNAAIIAASQLTYSLTEPGALMRGPDDKIYIAGGCDYYDPLSGTMDYSRNIHVIENPNLGGITASNLQMNVYTTPRECGMGLPTCYYPTQATNTCGPILTVDANVSSNNICIDDCVVYTNLSVGPAVSYDWTFQGGTPSTFSGLNPPNICYSTPGNYTTTLTITNCSGNTSTTNLNIAVDNCTSPVASYIPSNTTLCEGDCITFTDNSTGTNINNWSWTFNGGTPTNFNGQNPGQVCFNDVGNHEITLSVTDDFGTDDTTIIITVNHCTLPNVSFGLSDLEICENECVTINNFTTGATSWIWTFEEGTPSISTLENPGEICFNSPGTYAVTLTAANSVGTSSSTQNIIIHPAPEIDLGNDIKIDEGTEVTINTGSVGSYIWTPEEMFSCQNCNSQTFTPTETITVSATIIDNNGCRATDEILVELNLKNDIFIPNTFTPDGNGINDLFGVISRFEIENFHIAIFNRWGEQIFESYNQNVLWDGTFNGTLVATGTYVWKLKGKNNATGKNIKKVGHISILN